MVTHHAIEMAYQGGGGTNEALNLQLQRGDPVGSRHDTDAAAINLIVWVDAGVFPRAVHQQLALERWAVGVCADMVDCQQR